jgi:lipopolysaccharide export system permease protein
MRTFQISEWQKEAAPSNLWPMRLLDRYLFRELFLPLAVCIIGFQATIIFVTALTEQGRIQEAKLHFGQTMEYAAASSMELVPYILPFSLLLALLWAITHHARYNEITAMRAAGISLWRICLPYFITGIIVSGALFALNELVIPRSLDFANRLLAHNEGSARATARVSLDFYNQSKRRMWLIDNYYPASRAMTGLKVEWSLPDGSKRRIYADHAVRTNGVWTFLNAQEFMTETNSMYVPVLKTNVLAMPEFDETPEAIHNEMVIANYLKQFEVQPLDIPIKDMQTFLDGHPNLSRGDRGRLRTELHERLARPFTCLVVVMIAIPFGAAPGRRNLFFGVAGSIFICFAFFVVSHLCEAFGANGSWPAWLAAWLPNILFGALGLILAMRIR